MLDLNSLNSAQMEAVTADSGPVLVIAGAGSGKTRTLVHRLAWLIQEGVPPAEILLLTFTRKASREMLRRAEELLPHNFRGIHGGTFHGFAFSVLRQYRPAWAIKPGQIIILDSSDCLSILHECKDSLKITKADRTFPKSQTIMGLLSKSRNKEISLSEVINNDAPHLLPHESDLLALAEAYHSYKRERNLLDYDDLLFELEDLLKNETILATFRERIKYIMVDEYQDTNLVQARITSLLAGPTGNIMAVGDDAQSIYAFRGANVRNILDFVQVFPTAKIVRLEENYRSTPPILNVANAILAEAKEGFYKQLFTTIKTNIPADLVRVNKPFNDQSQARLVAARIEELLLRFQPKEIAVLFRAGYQSYHLEVELGRRQRKFRKFGGLRYSEALHIKDVLAYARLCLNPLDEISFKRLAALSKGIGPKTAHKLYQALSQSDLTTLQRTGAKFPEFMADMQLLNDLRQNNLHPVQFLEQVIKHYLPKMQAVFPDDWPRRKQGLDEMLHIADAYQELAEFVADLSLDNPELSEDDENCITLSTIHSAKGLEWDAVIILDLVADRFPSRHALLRSEDLEEERRLMYVACTRARDSLDLCVPSALYNRQLQGNDPVLPSVFVQNLPFSAISEWQEGYLGSLSRKETPRPLKPSQAPVKPSQAPVKTNYAANTNSFSSPKERSDLQGSDPKCGFCRHKIFGRGKIVEQIPPDRCRVNFPGFGLKVIMLSFLELDV